MSVCESASPVWSFISNLIKSVINYTVPVRYKGGGWSTLNKIQWSWLTSFYLVYNLSWSRSCRKSRPSGRLASGARLERTTRWESSSTVLKNLQEKAISVSDPYSLNPEPAKNLNPVLDPSCFLTLPKINIFFLKYIC